MPEGAKCQVIRDGEMGVRQILLKNPTTELVDNTDNDWRNASVSESGKGASQKVFRLAWAQ